MMIPEHWMSCLEKTILFAVCLLLLPAVGGSDCDDDADCDDGSTGYIVGILMGSLFLITCIVVRILKWKWKKAERQVKPNLAQPPSTNTLETNFNSQFGASTHAQYGGFSYSNELNPSAPKVQSNSPPPAFKY